MSDDSWSLISHNEACSSIAETVSQSDPGSQSNSGSYAIIDGSFGVSVFDLEGSPQMQPDTQSEKKRVNIFPMILRRPDWWTYGKNSIRKKSKREFSLQELALIQ
jgi:hypothetical protein